MKVLIVQSETDSVQTLTEIFVKRGDEVFSTLKVDEAISILQQDDPELMILDLHLPRDILLELLRTLRKRYPAVRVIISNRYIDLSRELDVKEFGANIFLRAPFTKIWVEKALEKLEHYDPEEKQSGKSIKSANSLLRSSQDHPSLSFTIPTTGHGSRLCC